MIINNDILQQNPLTEGGEGIIYEYNNMLLKIYKKCVKKDIKLKKLKLLMNKKLSNNIIKPIELLYNNNNEFIGFSMKKIKGEEFKRLSNNKFIKTNHITTKNILKMLIDIKNNLINLHKQNIFIGDLNDSNILFDKNNNIYFIDIDSWTVENEKCDVCMETFKDPQLISNNFNTETDNYAFAILCFKSLTRIHPFGGTTPDNMNIIDRMKNKLSIIDNTNVKIPHTINNYIFIYPKLIKKFKDIFDNNSRELLDKSLDKYYNNNKYCKTHNIDYYNGYDKCPLCNKDAKLIKKPKKLISDNTISCIKLFDKNIDLLLSKDTYLYNNYIYHISSNNKVKQIYGSKIYFSNNGDIIFISNDNEIIINNKYIFKKQYKTDIVIYDNIIYYISDNNILMCLKVYNKGNQENKLCNVSYNTIYNVYNEKYFFVCNNFQNKKILNINGFNYELNNNIKINNYGIHFDNISKQWLFIIDNNDGTFNTYIFDNNKLIYKNDNIKYIGDLSNICFYNKIIFKSNNKCIVGFRYDKNIYKQFDCDMVNEDSKLIKNNKKFIIINEKQMYEFG